VAIIMDTPLKRLLILLLVFLVPTMAVFGYIGYSERAYRSSFSSTLDYVIEITPDAPLHQVTFFLPIPVDARGTSPILTRIGEGSIEGMPDAWNATLLGANESAFIKLTAQEVLPVYENGILVPYLLHVANASKEFLTTRNTVENGYVLRPFDQRAAFACPSIAGHTAENGCVDHESRMYADYIADPDTHVEVSLHVMGRNEWYVFSEGSATYREIAGVTLTGVQQGWHTLPGMLHQGMGEEYIHYWNP
jgi:hypothetical protein